MEERTDFPFNLGTQCEQGTYDQTILDHEPRVNHPRL